MNQWSIAQQKYIDKNDLLNAYERFRTAYKNWKDHWWAVVEEIWTRCSNWAREWVLDPIKRTLEPLIVKRRGRKATAMVGYRCEAYGMGAYIVQHFNSEDVRLWTKVGKADDVQKRLAQHLNKDYKGTAVRAECIAFYPAKNSNHALSIENVLRDFFNRKHALLGNDRFPTLEAITPEEFDAIEKKLEILATIF